MTAERDVAGQTADWALRSAVIDRRYRRAIALP
jgi:hypothetical protein